MIWFHRIDLNGYHKLTKVGFDMKIAILLLLWLITSNSMATMIK